MTTGKDKKEELMQKQLDALILLIDDVHMIKIIVIIMFIFFIIGVIGLIFANVSAMNYLKTF